MLEYRAFSPDRIYELDANKDGRKDIIIRSYFDSGNMDVFLRQEDGSLLRTEYNNARIRDYAKSTLEKS